MLTISNHRIWKKLAFLIKLTLKHKWYLLANLRRKTIDQKLNWIPRQKLFKSLWNRRVWKEFKYYLVISGLLHNNSSEKRNKKSIFSPTRFENLMTVLAYSRFRLEENQINLLWIKVIRTYLLCQYIWGFFPITVVC